MIKLEKTYPLNAESIDRISEEVMQVCADLNMRRDQSIKTRLVLEDALMVWLKKLGEDTEIEVKADQLFFKPYLNISCRNERSCNPLTVAEQDFFTDSILKTLTASPDFIYRKGRNNLHFKLQKPESSPFVKIILVVAAALMIGFLGAKFLPAAVISGIQTGFISPTYKKFLDVLRCIAGPLIFCSVTWGIYGIGDTSTLSKLGKGLILHFLRDIFLVTVCCAAFFPVFGCKLTEGAANFSSLFAIYTMLLDMLPLSIVDPFATGNTLQIIVLAACLGIALIYMGKRTQHVAVAIEQLNLITTFLMTVISKLVPFFIAFVLIHMIWSGSLGVLAQSWKFFLVLLSALTGIVLFKICFASIRFRVRVFELMKKILPPFLIALMTASSSAAFGQLMTTCEKKFGISSALTGFGVPLGIVIYKLGSAVNCALLAFYIAAINHIECSLSWIIMAVIVSAIVAIATPPIPGGATIAYTMLFTQLGLPEESLAIAFAFDMVTDFLKTSVNIFSLPFGLVNVAAKYDLLDREVLRKAAKAC